MLSFRSSRPPFVIETAPVTVAERADLRDPGLTQRLTWSYPDSGTTYVLFTRPDVKVVPGNQEVRKEQFPDIYLLIELDRKRQSNALMIPAAKVKEALEEQRKANGPGP